MCPFWWSPQHMHKKCWGGETWALVGQRIVIGLRVDERRGRCHTPSIDFRHLSPWRKDVAHQRLVEFWGRCVPVAHCVLRFVSGQQWRRFSRDKWFSYAWVGVDINSHSGGVSLGLLTLPAPALHNHTLPNLTLRRTSYCCRYDWSGVCHFSSFFLFLF